MNADHAAGYDAGRAQAANDLKPLLAQLYGELKGAGFTDEFLNWYRRQNARIIRTANPKDQSV